jgi:ABC-type lipoprotein export system ATPase subunit
VSRPALVLADEPTGNLDTASSGEVFELMRRFNRKLGITFLIVSHESRIASRCRHHIHDRRRARAERPGESELTRGTFL